MADPWAAFVSAPKDDPWAAFVPGSQAAQPKTIDMVPAYDAMGNPTGEFVPAQAAPEMSYGDQMRKVGTLVDNTGRLIANGLTFGMADRFAGAMDAVTGQAPSYSEGVNRQAGRTEDIRQSAPVASAIAEGIGGLAGGVGLMKNGVTLMGRAGQGLVGRMAAMGAEGAAYGAAHGAGNTYTENGSDYVDAAGKGAAVGGLIGAGLPAAGSLASSLYQAARNFGGAPIPGMSRTSSGLLRSAASADEAGMRALDSNVGMLPDAGPSMLGLAQGAATSNGPGKSALVNALREREAGTVQRLAQGADEFLGPAPIPSRVEAEIAADRAVRGEGYGPVMDGARAVDLQPLAGYLDSQAVNLRGPAQRAVREVRQMLDIPGNPGQLDPNPQALHATREAIDGLLENEANPQVIRQLTLARQHVDRTLAEAAPGMKAVDGPMRELFRQSEGLQRGGQVFDTRKTAIRPAEFADDFRGAAIPQGEMVGPSAEPFRMRQGMRAEVDRAVGTSSNDLLALERKFGTPEDWNARKAGIAFGETPMEQFNRLIADERNRRNTYQKVAEGSRTAPTQSAAASMEAKDGPRGDMTLTGLGARLGSAGFRALMGLTRANTKEEVAQVLAQSGDAAQATRELLALQQRATGETARLLARIFGAPEAIGAATPAAGHR